MAKAPEFKIYDSENKYQAACKEPEQAAALVSFLGNGSTIRHGHSLKDVLWTEGQDGCASESYDQTRCLIITRILENHRKRKFDPYQGERRLYPID